MKILYIWYGIHEPLYHYRDKCIRRALELYPDAHFQVITNLDTFYGMEVISNNDVRAQMEEQGYYTHKRDYLRTSDEMRFWWLSQHKNTLYLDTDTWCKEPMPVSPEPGKLAIEALWTGEDTSQFANMLATRERHSLYITLEKKLELRDLSKYFEHTPTTVRSKKHLPWQEEA